MNVESATLLVGRRRGCFRVFHICSGSANGIPISLLTRLNEKSAVRTNANRLFDSQNNNRGGYNVGDKTNNPAGANLNRRYQVQLDITLKY